MINDEMMTAIEKLTDAIVDDYDKTAGSDRPNAYREFAEKIKLKAGKKYIKIIQQHSAWGFIVNCHDDKKFEYGDILMAASWKTPARNSARGNVFTKYSVNWTGPNYLK